MRTTPLGPCAFAEALRNRPAQNRPIKDVYRIVASCLENSLFQLGMLAVAPALNGHAGASPARNVMNARRLRSGRDVRFIARPPPRSVRAAFPHTAPASGV